LSAAPTRRALAFAVLFAIGAGVTPARDQTTDWTDATGSWFVPGNWSAGVPTGATVTTTVGNGGTAQIAGAAANAGNGLIINGGSTVDLQAGGSLIAGGFLIAGNSTLLLSGSTAVTGGIFFERRDAALDLHRSADQRHRVRERYNQHDFGGGGSNAHACRITGHR
jgi:hypothetical protein